MRFKRRSAWPLKKKAHRGFRGYPVATLAFYGRDDQRASKVAEGVVVSEGAEPIMKRWFTEDSDIRHDQSIAREILQFTREYGVKSVVSMDRIIGCPHEEGIDYEGEVCPKCPFWTHRDRWTGDLIL